MKLKTHKNKFSRTVNSSHGSVPGGEKPVVHLPTPPRSIISPSAVPGRGNSEQISHSPDANGHLIRIEKKGAKNLGSDTRVRKKRRKSRFQKTKEKLKRLKAEVEEQTEETNQMQAAAEGIELALAHGWAENELMMEQNLQDQHLLLMLYWRYFLDSDAGPVN
ncbi:hypothetical protein SLEP1_g44241 [Rubroshorea leprosula]|uniref:BZIP domain-containing protein n=1 Tax=Rubroshorea leprosula TaxID=152421 RepID=A0AAV5LFK4_9ROSI|nr:hypothetical protein SLEP1_g44241 [Rubroshorea leprosula]